MIVFRNPGIVDINALIVLGVSVKLDSSPIGYFGTGFKYAVATLLRHGCKITVHSGGESYEFTETQTLIRGESFGLVSMNGRELGFTTALGKNWEPWQACRELYSNALDEGGGMSSQSEIGAYSPDETLVLVEGEAIERAYRNRKGFLFLDLPDVVTKVAEIALKPSTVIYYHGIAIANLSIQSKFTYNFLVPIELTEDRTMKYEFEIDGLIGQVLDELIKLGEEDIVEDILCPGDRTKEFRIRYNEWFFPASERIITRIGELRKTREADLVPEALKLFESKLKHTLEELPEAKLSELEAGVLDSSIEFCFHIGFPVTEYPILVIERLGNGVLGQAKNKKIYLSKEVFELGAKMISGTLIEEYIHLSKGVFDGSRAMQNVLVNAICSIGENYVHAGGKALREKRNG